MQVCYFEQRLWMRNASIWKWHPSLTLQHVDQPTIQPPPAGAVTPPPTVKAKAPILDFKLADILLSFNAPEGMKTRMAAAGVDKASPDVASARITLAR
jgi:hypothetical protein